MNTSTPTVTVTAADIDHTAAENIAHTKAVLKRFAIRTAVVAGVIAVAVVIVNRLSDDTNEETLITA
jgi:hypothetical protein